MKKNGFTLVEITVCVVLLVTIFLLVVPKVNTMINNKKKNAYNSLISTVKDAAQAYVYLNVNIVDDAIESQGYYEVSIRTLQENELLEKFQELEEYKYHLNKMQAGTVLFSDDKKGLFIKANGGILQVLEIQGENSKRMAVGDFLRGNPVGVGNMFE